MRTGFLRFQKDEKEAGGPHASLNQLYLKEYFMYNRNILKKEKCANTSPSNLYRQGGGCQKAIFIFENHPYACDGEGWFSCFLAYASERNRRSLHAQPLSELHEEIQAIFP